MKTNLLNDILNEGDYPQFRDDLRAQFGAEARRSHRQRRFNFIAITALAASVAMIASFLFVPGRSDSRQALKTERVPVIHSTALREEQVLTTKPVVVEMVASRATVISFSTSRNPELESIDDSQLLAIFHDHPAGLFQTSQGEQFVFVNPEDTKKFMSSN